MVLISDALRYQQKIAGRTLRVRYYTETIGSVWDDERTVALSGTTHISGTVHKIDTTPGSTDKILLEQGRINFDDTVFFVNGSLDTTSGVKVFTIAISGDDTVYRAMTPGTIQPQYLGDTVYQKIYGRFLPNGSLF